MQRGGRIVPLGVTFDDLGGEGGIRREKHCFEEGKPAAGRFLPRGRGEEEEEKEEGGGAPTRAQEQMNESGGGGRKREGECLGQ